MLTSVRADNICELVVVPVCDTDKSSILYNATCTLTYRHDVLARQCKYRLNEVSLTTCYSCRATLVEDTSSTTNNPTVYIPFHFNVTL